MQSRKLCFLLSLIISAQFLSAQALNESFSGSFPPEFWTVYNLDGGLYSWSRSTVKFLSAPACAGVKAEGKNITNDDWLVTRKVYPVPGNNLLTFFYRSQTPKRESLEVYVSTTTNQPSAFIHRLDAFGFTNNTAYAERSISLAQFDSTPIYIAFRYPKRGGKTVYIDDVSGPFYIPKDVGVKSIISPPFYLGVGDTVFPRVLVKNYGSTKQVGFTTTLFIIDSLSGDTVYNQEETVDSLPAQDSIFFSFTSAWLAEEGVYRVKAFTSLDGDMNLSNDTARKRVRVTSEVIKDVAVTAILNPVGTIPPGQVIPQARVANYGTNTETFLVAFNILSQSNLVYTDTAEVTLLRNGTADVNFNYWDATEGIYQTLVRAILDGDIDTTNNKQTGSFDVVSYYRDVGVDSIISPKGEVLQNSTNTPRAEVENYGDLTESLYVWFTIGSNYQDSIFLTINPGERKLVNFQDWIASEPGKLITKCSTSLAGDEDSTNNFVFDSVFVRIKDVGVIQITSPSGVIDSGTIVVPQAQVQNFGNAAETFSVTFRIGAFYNQTRTKTLSAGATDTVNFPSWTAVQKRGTHPTRCTIAIADVNPANNALSDSVMIRVLDVGVSSILAPSGTIDSGAVIVPQAQVQNFGNTAETFSVTFRIGAFYNQTRTKTLLAGATDTVNFPSWTAIQRGTHTTRCTIALADANLTNNTQSDSVKVQVKDVGVIQITSPSGVIDSGATVTPRVKIKNFGNTSVSFSVWFRVHSTDNLPTDKIRSLSDAATHGGQQLVGMEIDQIYEDSLWLTLSPGDSAVRDFRSWTATIPDTYRLESFASLSGDMNRRNDSAYGSVIVRRPVHDVGAIKILAPTGVIDSGRVVIPQVVVQNFGQTSETFQVRFQIGTFYITDTVVTLAVGQIDTVGFFPWTAIQIGTHITKCSTRLTSDINPANNSVRDSVKVVSPPVKVIESYNLPKVFTLTSFPNPFISQTLIQYALPKDCPVRLLVYNSSGIIVRILKAGSEKAGFYRIIWNGCDDTGRKVSHGVYFYRLEANEFRITKKMVMLKQ